MIAFMVPGHGSQRAGMGRKVLGRFPELTSIADEILGYSVRKLCLDGPESKLRRTEFSQPAIFVVNALSYQAMLEQSISKPQFLIGHSLGEYNALCAAGAFDFPTGLRLVQKRSQLMAQAQGGGMAAVIGLTATQVQDVLSSSDWDDVDIANCNTKEQIVISGPDARITRGGEHFERAGAAAYIPLRVSGAFHSRYMQFATDDFQRFLESVEIVSPSIPVISNVEAKPFRDGTVKSLLVRQHTQPVRWEEFIHFLLAAGVSRFDSVGEDTVLDGRVRTIRSETNGHVVPQKKETVRNTVSIKPGRRQITATSLGSSEFRTDYGIKYAYVAGAMHKGIASQELVVKMGKSGLLAFLGTQGMQLADIESAIRHIQSHLTEGQSYGMNLVRDPAQPEIEEQMVDLFL